MIFDSDLQIRAPSSTCRRGHVPVGRRDAAVTREIGNARLAVNELELPGLLFVGQRAWRRRARWGQNEIAPRVVNHAAAERPAEKSAVTENAAR